MRRSLDSLTRHRAARTALIRLRRLGRGGVVLDTLAVAQDGHHLDVAFTVGRGITARAVWARGAAADEWTRLAVADEKPAGFAARIDMSALPPVPADAEDGALYTLAVEIDRTLHASDDRDAIFEQDPDADVVASAGAAGTVQYRAVLGQARHTDIGALSEVSATGRRLRPFVDANGVVAVGVGRPLPPYGSVYVSRLAVTRGVLHMRGRLASRHTDVVTAHLLLKGRTAGHRIGYDVPLDLDAARTARRHGLRWYRYDLRVDCATMLADPAFTDDTYDAWFRLRTDRDSGGFEVRVGRTRLLARYLTRPGWARRGARSIAVSPYYTFKAKRTSFHLLVFDAENFAYLRRKLRMRHIDRALHWRRDIWLIGELPYKAQDTGYWFFRYVCENHPEVEAYYVIARDSPERANVAPLGNVIDFGSKTHIRLALLATKVIGSHHPDFLYPLRTAEVGRAMRAARVFLQHGVMGTKWMASLYGKQATTFDTDLFIVSSEREREYIVGDFGYATDEIAITGLSRFDSLFAADVDVNPHQILIMPTWRDWLQDPDLYVESEYHRTWSALLHDRRLRALVDAGGLEIVFCLHPNMQHFSHLFTDVPARVINQGDVDVQLLLKRSAMLVTDYSSVGFDFGFLHKPVVYYQFDREQFLGDEGSHLDLDEELPGPIFRSATLVLAEVADRVADGFTMAAQYQRRADRFLAHRDRNNNARIFEVVRHARRRRHLGGRLASSEVVRVVPNYLRTQRLYFPAMRRLFVLVKRLPMARNVVVFESGVGKQYADSPRYIYEELERRYPHVTKVWAYDGRLPASGPNTKVVKRLSVGYFFWLARARYWVNNQSFPHYVTRRADGVYVQTWHGTPLKRMLHDLEQVHGRDPGYVQRATTAAQQWSLLVSPNRFTTEVMSSAFGYRGDVLEVGYPRNDVLHDPDRDRIAARIRARLGIRRDQRVVLYAPTFRDDQMGASGRFDFELPFDLDRLHEALGPDTVVLLRMHVLVGALVEIPPHLRDAIRDVSRYPEIQELFLVSDVLVTDYSSVFFDFASMRRPILFYAYDLEKYRRTLRGFYLDYEKDLPGPIVETEAELIHALTHLDEVRADTVARLDAFLERFAPLDDGHAAARVVEAVFGHERRSLSDRAAPSWRERAAAVRLQWSARR